LKSCTIKKVTYVVYKQSIVHKCTKPIGALGISKPTAYPSCVSHLLLRKFMKSSCATAFLLPHPTEMKQELTTAPQLTARPSTRRPPAALEDEGATHGCLSKALLEVRSMAGTSRWCRARRLAPLGSGTRAFFDFQLSTAHFPAGTGFFSGAVTVGATVFAAGAGSLFFDGSVAWAVTMEHLFMGMNTGRVWAVPSVVPTVRVLTAAHPWHRH
jgi:hypothetical protein